MNSNTEQNKPRCSCFRIVHCVFTLTLLAITLYLLYTTALFRYDMEWVNGYTTDVYRKTEKTAENPESSPRVIVNQLIEAYRMRSPMGSSDSQIRKSMDYTEHLLMKYLVHVLEKKTDESFGDDLDAWIEKYASPDDREEYERTKSYRKDWEVGTNPLKLE